MTAQGITCPYCRSDHVQLLTDDAGCVGWCQDCHRAWIVPQHQPQKSPKDDKLRLTA